MGFWGVGFRVEGGKSQGLRQLPLNEHAAPGKCDSATLESPRTSKSPLSLFSLSRFPMRVSRFPVRVRALVQCASLHFRFKTGCRPSRSSAMALQRMQWHGCASAFLAKAWRLAAAFLTVTTNSPSFNLSIKKSCKLYLPTSKTSSGMVVVDYQNCG